MPRHEPARRQPATASAVRRRGGSSGKRVRPGSEQGSASAKGGGRRLRRLAVFGLAAVAVALALWVGRDLPFWRVERVTIVGLDEREAAAARHALVSAARRMTVFHVDHSELRAALASYPAAADVTVDRRLPDELVLRVRLRRPVAVLEGARGRVAVAGDGTQLGDLSTPSSLPTIAVGDGPDPDARLAAPVRAKVAVAASAPAPLRTALARISLDRDRGLVAALRSGPLLIFGRAHDLNLKWRSISTVLARDPSASRATYIDVRLPRRPVAGGLGNPASAARPLSGGTIANPQPTPQSF